MQRQHSTPPGSFEHPQDKSIQQPSSGSRAFHQFPGASRTFHQLPGASRRPQGFFKGPPRPKTRPWKLLPSSLQALGLPSYNPQRGTRSRSGRQRLGRAPRAARARVAGASPGAGATIFVEFRALQDRFRPSCGRISKRSALSSPLFPTDLSAAGRCRRPCAPHSPFVASFPPP